MQNDNDNKEEKEISDLKFEIQQYKINGSHVAGAGRADPELVTMSRLRKGLWP